MMVDCKGNKDAELAYLDYNIEAAAEEEEHSKQAAEHTYEIGLEHNNVVDDDKQGDLG